MTRIHIDEDNQYWIDGEKVENCTISTDKEILYVTYDRLLQIEIGKDSGSAASVIERFLNLEYEDDDILVDRTILGDVRSEEYFKTKVYTYDRIRIELTSNNYEIRKDIVKEK